MKRLSILAATAAILATLSTPAGVSAAPDRLTCAGYPEARSFTSGQTWWLPEHGHVHVEGCLPHEQIVRSVVGLDLRVVMHDSHTAKFDRTEPVLNDDASGEIAVGRVTTCQGLTTDTGTAECWEHVDVDTTKFNFDGRNEIRLRSWAKTPGIDMRYGTSDDALMHVSLNIMVDARNGKPVNPLDRLPYERGKGWYGGGSFGRVGYCEARLVDKVPTAPVSGILTLRAEWPTHADSIPVTHHEAALNPRLHDSPPDPGQILVSADGPGAVTPISIDTSKLPAGPNRLALRSDCLDSSGSTNSGVLSITFVVAGAPSPTPSPVPSPTPTSPPTC